MTTSRDEAVNAMEGSPALRRTLTALVRATFPHPDVPAAAYERIAATVQEAAAATPFMHMKLTQGLASLEHLTEGRFSELTPQEALPVLLRIARTPFFGFVRQTAVVNLYEDEDVWEALGYEGPSFDKGGYIDRGFDDLDWLPEPRIEEYDGEPLPDIISDLPGSTGAADTRPAAVPAGQNRARAGRTNVGRSAS